MRNNLKGWNTVNIAPFLLSTIIRIRVVIAKFSRGFGTENPSLCGIGLIADGKSGYLIVCLDLEVIPVMSVKQK